MPQARAHLVEKKTENQLVDVDKVLNLIYMLGRA